MPDTAPRLSFGATSVSDLMAAARGVADPTLAVDWEQLASDTAARVEQLVEANGHVVEIIREERIGYVVYEDEAQVVAEPFANTRTDS